MEFDNEENMLLKTDKKCYKTRWWILFISTLHFIHQNIGMNTWGPIAQSAKTVYNWEDTTIAFILNMGRLGGLVSVFFVCYLLDRTGKCLSEHLF